MGLLSQRGDAVVVYFAPYFCLPIIFYQYILLQVGNEYFPHTIANSGYYTKNILNCSPLSTQ